MNASTRIERLVENLAASWTEVVLETLNAAGLGPVTVQRELETWRLLKVMLRSELRWQRVFRSSVLVSLSEIAERVLWKTALWIAKKLRPQAAALPGFATRLRRLTAGRGMNRVDRHLFAEIAREPSMPGAFKSPLSTDFIPRPRLVAAV